MKNKGFTLLELILTISIILILLSVSTFSFNVKDKIESKYQIKEFVTNIKFIKNYAQINNCRTSIVLTEDGYTIHLDNKSKEIKFNKLIEVSEKNVSDIRFTTTGKPSFLNKKNSAGTIVFIVDKDKQYTLKILPVTGKVNLIEN